MNILDKIIEHKKVEVAAAKIARSLAVLEQSELYKRDTISLKKFLLRVDKTGIIAEFKRQSPSKGIMNATADVVEVTSGYTLHGASCLSILTDEFFFGGMADDLIRARVNEIPILRKDFIIDEYQITEAKAMGADAILLIAACLSPTRVQELSTFAKQLQLEVLLELHSENELEHICAETELVGINNRDLKTFSVDIKHSLDLAQKIPADKIKIAESGIDSVETIRIFKNAGYKGFLIGEKFMKTANPTIAFAQFVQQLNARDL